MSVVIEKIMSDKSRGMLKYQWWQIHSDVKYGLLASTGGCEILGDSKYN